MPYLNVESGNMRYVSLGLCIAALCISLISILIVWINRNRDRKEAIYLLHLVIYNTLLAAAYTLELFIAGEPGKVVFYLMYIADFLEFMLPYLQAMSLTFFILYLIAQTGVWSPAKWPFFVVYGVASLVDLIGCISHQFFYIDQANCYHRGPWFLESQILGFILLFANAEILRRKGYRIRKTAMMALIVFIFVPMAAVIVQSIIQGANIFVLSTTLCALLLITFMQMRQTIESSQNEKELAELKITMLLSQMKPHFLYNALSSISQLCKKDPMRASEMTDRFAEFLRKNMNDVQKKEPIPFAEELKHVQNYISIEQMRFGDIIRVEYQIETTDFDIPALVLQPIIENAIRHGIRERENGGIIRITTRRVSDSCVLTVTDDGVGFDLKNLDPNKDGRVHLGVSSVRKRIDAVRGASFSITSTPGIGTTAVFVFPYKPSGMVSAEALK